MTHQSSQTPFVPPQQLHQFLGLLCSRQSKPGAITHRLSELQHLSQLSFTAMCCNRPEKPACLNSWAPAQLLAKVHCVPRSPQPSAIQHRGNRKKGSLFWGYNYISDIFKLFIWLE